ncbi:MAG: phosphoribosylformylglycinamidine cyclo-ligase [Methanomassiliicoccales archaeon]
MEMKRGWTYARAGVDIDRKSRAIESLTRGLSYRREGKGRMVDAEGQFTGLIDFGEVYLTLCTDGVGTKLMVAEETGRWETVGIDCVAMNVNDTICVGAEPVAFVDYIAIHEPDEEITGQIGVGLGKGAEMSNMDIVGGEVAVLPEMVSGVDLSGTCLGMVPKGSMIDGSTVSPGDLIVGLPSSGIHSNGLTLARRILRDQGVGYGETPLGSGRSIGEELLEPTRIYVQEVLSLLESVPVKGMVNITGGGVRNLLRLGKGVGFELDDPMESQPVFDLLSSLGEVEEREMYQTFNMGMGFALVLEEEQAEEALRHLEGAKVVGKVTSEEGVHLPHLQARFNSY